MTEKKEDDKKKERSKHDQRKWRDSVDYRRGKEHTDYCEGKKSSTRWIDASKKKEKKTYKNGNKTCWEACHDPDKPKAGECTTAGGEVVRIPEIETR